MDVFTKIHETENQRAQTFIIDNTINNFITGESGSLIRINKNIFVDHNGKSIGGEIDERITFANRNVKFSCFYNLI